MKYNNNKKLKLIKKLHFDKYFNAKSWEDYNKQFFNGLAKKYDATNILHSFGTKKIIDRKVIEKITFPKNAKVLDIATGSGDISICVSKIHRDAKITALDTSENMLSVAKEKSKGLNNIKFVLGDALKLPFKDNTFDVAIISFGLRNLADLEIGLKEMQRVVKPGGIVCNVDQGKPTNLVFKPIYKIYFYYIAPLLGKIIFHRREFNSFRYLPESNRYFPDQRELVEIMKKMNLKNVKNYDYWMGAVAQQVSTV